MKWAVLAIATLLSMIAYRAGGMSQDDNAKPTWIPKWMRHSWVRDWICPLFGLTVLGFFWRFNWEEWPFWVISYAAMGGAFSTYWDEFFGYDNFYMHGFMEGLAVFPLCFCGLPLWVPALHAVVMGWCMGKFCMKVTVDWEDEFERGAVATFFRMLVL